MSNNLFLRAYYEAQELEYTLPETAKLIRELDENRMKLIRMIEKVTEDPSIYDFLEITEEWLDEASDLVFHSRYDQS